MSVPIRVAIVSEEGFDPIFLEACLPAGKFTSQRVDCMGVRNRWCGKSSPCC